MTCAAAQDSSPYANPLTYFSVICPSILSCSARPTHDDRKHDDPCGHPDNDQIVRVEAVEDPNGLPVPLTQKTRSGTRRFGVSWQRLALSESSAPVPVFRSLSCPSGETRKRTPCT